MDGNNIPVIPRTINDLIESSGLLRIAHDHKATLLASCETALGERDEKISALQAENAKLRKVAETAKGFAYEDRTLEKPEWWWLEELRRSLTEAGYKV